MEQWILWALSILVALFTGSFLKSYMSKKGENLATHEDIQELVEQVQAVTTATKEIEAKISIDVWERQRKWDLKRETVFESLKELAVVENTLASLIRYHRRASKEFLIDSPELRLKSVEDFTAAQLSFKKASILTGVVCGPEIRTQFLHLVPKMNRVGHFAMEGTTDKAWSELVNVGIAVGELLRLIRNDLGMGVEPESPD